MYHWQCPPTPSPPHSLKLCVAVTGTDETEIWVLFAFPFILLNSIRVK